ncbi:MAG TPA: hypothetical protein VF593_00570 [Chthoniobacteraceae bacterium]
MRRVLSALALLLLCGLAFAARCHNLREILIEGRVYFTDADCYSRMTRARAVAEGHGLFQRHHDFENWPHGTEPHTTAPMDWAILAAKGGVDLGFRLFDPSATSVLRNQTLDLAGALISPIFGVLTCGWLGWWALGLRKKQGTSADSADSHDLPDHLRKSAKSADDSSPSLRWPAGAWLAVPLLFAISPILVHGTLLGRPDHQSLLIFLISIGLTCELRLAETVDRGWSICSASAWALALWVSLYEPLVLLLLLAPLWLAFDRQRFTAREHRISWVIFATVLLAAFALDGWRITWPDPELRTAFLAWKQNIGELAPLDPRAPLLYSWVGLGIIASPLLLGFAGRWDRRAWAIFVLLLATFLLTLWQLRWGYFLVLLFAISLPWQFAAARRWWIAWPLFLLLLWPLALDWDRQLFPEDHLEIDAGKARSVRRLEAVRLRDLAETMRHPERQPFLAPWWLSPSIAYWSGQPGVAGSSHESLPGIAATARFFLSPDAAEAEQIAREVGVRWILTDDPDRLIATSQALLGSASAPAEPYIIRLHLRGEPRERVNQEDLRAASPKTRRRLLEMADLAEAEVLGSSAFTCAAKNDFYKLFRMRVPLETAGRNSPEP